MLALLETETVKRKCSAEVSAFIAAGAPCIKMILKVPKSPRKRAFSRCVTKAGDILRELKVRDVCFRDDFPYRELFLEIGFNEQGRSALLRAKAGEIVASCAENTDHVLISADWVNAEVLRAAELLSGCFRYITLDVPQLFSRSLFACAERSGLSPKLLGRGRHCDASAAVFFGEPEREVFLPGDCRTLFTGERRPYAVSGGREIRRVRFSVAEKMKDCFPTGYQADRLLSYAVQRGAVSEKDIRVLG